MNTLEMKGIRLVIHLPAELDHHVTEELRKKIDRMIQEEPISELEFDFAGTRFMDSAGIGMIIGRYKMMQALDGRILASHMSGQIRRVLALSGIQKYMQLDKEEAV